MKRILIIGVLGIVVLIVSLYLYNMNKPFEKSDKGNLPSSVESPKMKAEMYIKENDLPKTINKISFNVKNTGLTGISFGKDYSIETFKRNTWYKVPFKTNAVFTADALQLSPGGTYEGKISLDILQYKLPKGKYRIVKDLGLNENKVTLAAEFTIH